ncbi:MAG: hypothetical protein JXJ18_09600 [Rhodobacteraceae bacterium]|nr:hypothetical protein [Paracoccaceae bacterium]
MSNPFENRAPSLSGPATDIVPVTPSDSGEMADVATSLYVETGGVLALVTVAGQPRTVMLGDRAFLPVGVRQVLATGTTASGIHALVMA